MQVLMVLGEGGVVERRVVLSWKAPECSGTARFNLNSAGSRNSSRRYGGQSSLSNTVEYRFAEVELHVISYG